MRIPRVRVAENRERLLRVATDQFREHGIDGIGIADLTKEAGMALGSFYGYFDSKEHLVAEACSRAIKATDHLLTSSFKSSGKGYEQIVDGYLSAAHRHNTIKGCVLAALGSEMAHQEDGVRAKTSPALETLFENFASKLPGNAVQRRSLAISTMASLVGGLILSRMIDAPEQSNEVLDTVRLSLKQQASKLNQKEDRENIMAKLDGKVALVTGGNSGIGFATAKLFAAAGAHVYITGRRLDKVGQTQQRCHQGQSGMIKDIDL